MRDHQSLLNDAEEVRQIVQSLSTSQSYQKKLILYFLMVTFFYSLPIFASNYYYMNPVFQCEGIEGKVLEDDACQIMQQCKAINQDTITSELHLYCDSRKTDRNMIQTAEGYGFLIGIAVVWLYSDRFGKRACIILGVCILNLTWMFQFIGVYTKSVLLLFLAGIIHGIAGKLITINTMVMLTRFLKKRDYELVTLGWFTFNRGLTQMVIPIMNELIGRWRVIACVYSVGIVGISVAAFFVLKEDPIYLVDSLQVEAAKRVIQQIGEENKQEPAKIQQNMDKLDRYVLVKSRMNSDSGKNYNLIEVLRCDIALNVLLIGLAGLFYQLSSKSIEFSVQNLNYSYNFNLFIIGISNVCGFTSAAYVIKVEKQRKRGLLYVIAITCLISMLFYFPFFTQNGVVESITIFLLRFFLCWNTNFFTRLQVDTFPEKYQTTLFGAAQFINCTGVIVGPLLVEYSIDHHINPILLVGVLKLIVGFIPMFLITQSRLMQSMPPKSIQEEHDSEN